MSESGTRSTNFWAVLDEARQQVSQWEAWKHKYEADIYYEGYALEARTAETVKRAKEPNAASS